MKKEEDIQINGIPYKKVTKIEKEKVVWIKNIPKVLREIHSSGLHIFPDKPDANHWDHTEKEKEWDEKL
ncbi:MAG TPA: hypothetical protein VJH65_00590 [Candidatus Nanoarchaeia archaeon]|nr:hypothetical protein [Candidatus Nanoarchaeia archaeon]